MVFSGKDTSWKVLRVIDCYLPTNVMVRQVDFLVCPAMLREMSEMTMLPCARKNWVQ